MIYHYYVGTVFSDAAGLQAGGIEVKRGEQITTLDDVIAVQNKLRRHRKVPGLQVVAVSLLRVEDAPMPTEVGN